MRAMVRSQECFRLAGAAKTIVSRIRAAVVLTLSLLILTGVLLGPASAQGVLGLIGSQAAEAETSEPGDAASDAALALDPDELARREAAEPFEAEIETALKARDVVKSIVMEVPSFPGTMVATLRAHGPDGSLSWIFTTALGLIVAVALGLLATTFVGRWGRRQFVYLYKQDVYHRADKLSYLFLRAILMTVGLVVFISVAGLIGLFLTSDTDAGEETTFVVVSTTALFLFVRIVFLNLLAPDAPTHRLVALSNANAQGLYRLLIGATVIAAVALGLCNLMDRLGLPEDAHKLALIAAAMLSMLLLSGIAIAYRHVIGDLIRGAKGTSAALWRRILAGSWHIIAVVYFVIAWAISAIRILLDLPDATGLVAAPLAVILVAAAGYGVLILMIDKVLLPRLDTPKVQAAILEDIQRADTSEDDSQDAESAAAQARAEAADREADRSQFRDLFDRGAAILVAFGSADLLANMWGVPLAGSGSFVGSFIEILLVMFLGYMAYESVKILIDRQIAKEAPAEKDEEAEVGGAGESRIATLLPIFRNFLLVTIVVIAAMVVLSELGVNIGPLFAGAGVVGLAIGFGAQTLIRDIFSGAFYLIDDAFRKGEYIDIGSAKGTVEKISIRSMQLRHHRGALTTVPFGEIQKVENFSRDWAIMKLAFRVTYDTDVDKMRKIIKKFGQELVADEYYGPMLLAPVKSQGILSMEDSAMIARVKFTAKPGKQFELRKVVYQGLRDLFEQNGIKFAHRQVTVQVAANGDAAVPAGQPPQPSTDVLKAAAGAAAAAGMIDPDLDPEGAASGDQL